MQFWNPENVCQSRDCIRCVRNLKMVHMVHTCAHVCTVLMLCVKREVNNIQLATECGSTFHGGWLQLARKDGSVLVGGWPQWTRKHRASL